MKNDSANPPYGTRSDIHPCLTYDDAASAIEWLCRVFGFTKRLVVAGPNAMIIHAELSFGTGVVMVSSPKPEFGRFGPRSAGGGRVTLSVYVADPDVHHANAVAAGARVTQPLRDEDYGARGYMAEDLEGHQWYFGTYRPGAHWWVA
jgi:uncharacterized glyoxalase superfamily protein PhnB